MCPTRASTRLARAMIILIKLGLILSSVSVQSSSCASTVAPTAVASADIVIDSLVESDGKTPPTIGERHLYEQPQVEQPATVAPPAAEDSTAAPAKDLNLKAEPRNQEDQAEPVIVDHRPSGADSQQDPQLTSGQQQHQQHQSTGSTTTQSPVYQPTSPAFVAQQYQISAPSSIQQQQQSSWINQQQANGYTQQQQPAHQGSQGQQNFAPSGSQMSSSNQIYTVQHPTSINSIINDQQQQSQAQQQQQAVGSPTNQQNSILAPATLNGQPASVILQVSPNGQMTNGQGRRISISSWLKGLSSMLASIFNRREHGALVVGGAPLMVQQASGQQQQQQQPQPSASSSIGHWLQLGPNAPHWLTQAQSLIQQQQFHHQFSTNNNPLGTAASSTRFTFLQAPQQQQQQQQPPTMTITVQPVGGPYQQQQQSQSGASQDIMVASGSSPTNYLTVAQPSVQIQPTQAAQPNQQQQQLLTGNISGQPQQQQVSSSRQSATTQSQQSSPSPNQATNSNQPQQQQQTTRFSRSSSSSSSALAQSGNQNLPLAHYSRLVSA